MSLSFNAAGQLMLVATSTFGLDDKFRWCQTKAWHCFVRRAFDFIVAQTHRILTADHLMNLDIVIVAIHAVCFYCSGLHLIRSPYLPRLKRPFYSFVTHMPKLSGEHLLLFLTSPRTFMTSSESIHLDASPALHSCGCFRNASNDPSHRSRSFIECS